jgi:adenylosuccinate lyase
VLKVASLRSCFSEYALIKFRMLVECRWLQLLSSQPDLPEVPRFSPEASAILEELCDTFTLETAQEVKDVERITNHDVKAVEYVLKRCMSANPELSKVLEFTHFACTSEDINNLAHGLMLKQARDQQLLPVMDSIVEALCHLAEEHAGPDT